MSYYLSNPIVIHDYDPHWPQLYAVEEQQLKEILSPYAVQIAHIGSTAIPALAAKPIIDIRRSTRFGRSERLCSSIGRRGICGGAD